MTNPTQILTQNFIKGLEYLQSLDSVHIREARLINREILIKSGRFEFNITGDTITGIMYREAHGIYQNFGVKRANFRIGLKKWLEVTKKWAKIVKPSLSDDELSKFQSAVYFKKKALPSSAFALKPRPWIKKGNDILDKDFNKIFDLTGFLEAVLDNSFDILAA